MATDRIRSLNAALGFGESSDVCQIFGTNPIELNNIIQLENFPNFANEALFGKFGTDIKLLDVRPTGNLILLIKPPKTSKLHNHLFVLKILFDSIPADEIDVLNDNIIAEHVISKIMLNLAKYRITPHGLGGIFTSPFIELSKKLKKEIGKFLYTQKDYNEYNRHEILDELDEKTHVASILQESFKINDDQAQIGNFTDLVNFKSVVFYYVLFQIMYTLAVFQRIGLKHNDLHTDNILVIQDEPPQDDTYTKYTIREGKDYYVKNIGVTSAIIDFGLSVKQPNPEANTRVIEHVSPKPSSGPFYRTKSHTAKHHMCFHANLNKVKILPEFLNVGDAGNDVMRYEDLYKLLNELFVMDEEFYDAKNTVKKDRKLISRISTRNKDIIKKIFFKENYGKEVNIDDFLIDISGNPKESFQHVSRDRYPEFVPFTNNYETILDNIVTHIFEISKQENLITTKIPKNITDFYNINNISGDSRTLNELAEGTRAEKELLDELEAALKALELKGGSLRQSKKSKHMKSKKSKKSNTKKNRTSKIQ